MIPWMLNFEINSDVRKNKNVFTQNRLLWSELKFIGREVIGVLSGDILCVQIQNLRQAYEINFIKT